MGRSSGREGRGEGPIDLLRLFGGCFTLAGGLFLIGGILGFSWWTGEKNLSEESLHWPSARGVVLESRLIIYTSSGESSSLKTHYLPRIRYEFILDGDRYESNQRSIMGKNYDRDEAQRIVDAYPAGSDITVYFQPGNPEESVLERGGSEGQALIGNLVLASFLVFGSIATFVGIRLFRRRPHP